jgi:hypothetical protein
VYYLNATPSGMSGSYPWELLCAMVGIDDLETAREVWERFAIAKQVQQEHDEKKEKLRA